MLSRYAHLPATLAVMATLLSCGMQVDYDNPRPREILSDGWRLCNDVQGSEKNYHERYGTFGSGQTLGLKTCSEFYCADLRSEGDRYSAAIYPATKYGKSIGQFFYIDESGIARWGLKKAGPESEPVTQQFKDAMWRQEHMLVH